METIADVSRRIPVRREVREETDALGKLLLRRRKWGPVRTAVAKALRLEPDFTIHLDAVGAEAWRLMDGRRTVAQVKAELGARFPHEQDLSARLGRFIGTLVSKRMVELE